MRNLIYTLIACVLFATGCQEQESLRSIRDFNFDWRFTLGDDEAYATESYDDTHWRSLHLPHDWSIEGEFDANNPSTPAGGALPGGIGWYRKHFTTPNIHGKVVNVEFDGIFMNSTVYVNGHEVGFRPYGYSSLSYDITPYLKPKGERNIIAVRCDNSEQPNSRWYAGCGIYRNVRLVITPDVFVEYSGTYVTTPKVSDNIAEVHATITITNKSDADRHITVINDIVNADNKRVSRTKKEITIEAGKSSEVVADANVTSPHRWDIDNPYLYTLRTTIEEHDAKLDEYNTTFGIRDFKFDADTGFWLNGHNVKLLGVCMAPRHGRSWHCSTPSCLGASARHPRVVRRERHTYIAQPADT